MLIYGDSERRERCGTVRRSVAGTLQQLAATRPGIERHALLVRAFIRASGLVQGIADAEFEERGCDARSPRQDAGGRLLLLFAEAIDRSCLTGYRADATLPQSRVASLLEMLDDPGPVRIRGGEGYRHYALYPEAYLEAARRSGLGPATCVVGIRSIGLGLAALVAAALGASAPVSVRPTGHPFARRLAAGSSLTREIAADSDRDFAIVDEGPGLSGSSFGAVMEWLSACGVAQERIHLFPSHAGGPGAEASPALRQRWNAARRHVAGFETDSLKERVERWVSDLLGPLDAPLEDISGGAWRLLHYPQGNGWPPAALPFERSKFLARAGGEKWLVRFAGLGEDAWRKARDAARLHAAGFAPEPAGLRYGFLVERWVEGTPLDRAAVERDRLVGTMARYLGFRARRFPAPGGGGASLPELAAMACHNAGEALGSGAAARLEGRLANAAALDPLVRRVRTDGRLHAWEWLVDRSGRLVKTDALDHSAGHDLVGCQDIAWDVAGAAVEHRLSRAETEVLLRAVSETAGRRPPAELLVFLTPCYLAFQLGLWSFCATQAAPREAPRLRAAARRYRLLLRAWLEAGDRNGGRAGGTSRHRPGSVSMETTRKEIAMKPREDDPRDKRADTDGPAIAEQDWDAVEGAEIMPESHPQNGDLRYRPHEGERPGDLPGEDDDNPYQESDEALPDDKEEAALSRDPSKDHPRFDEV